MAESGEMLRPLMAGQQGIWQAQQLDLSSPIYNIGEYLDIRGHLNLGLFETALRHAVREFDAFRLRFEGEGESLRQYVADVGDWAPYVVDLSQEAEPVAAAMRWMRTDMAKAVNLREDRLFAFAVLRVAADRVFCYQRCHHVAMDGYSGSIVTGRVAEIYNALLGKKTSPRTRRLLSRYFSMPTRVTGHRRISRRTGPTGTAYCPPRRKPSASAAGARPGFRGP